MSEWELFHFLRPAWLACLPVIAVIWRLVRRRDALLAQQALAMPEHLRLALTMNRHNAGGPRPYDLVSLAFVFLVLAAAGPAWSKENGPWFAETAPLVIALNVSDRMRANDLLPTRLDRARFKILDLIAARTGARTALIAYAGSAHIVMPPTTDSEVLKPFLESLDPAIMPVPGAKAHTVLPLAKSLLGDNAAIGTVLFVTDEFDVNDATAFSTFTSKPDSPGLAAFVFGTQDGGLALLPDGQPVRGPGGARLDTKVDMPRINLAASAANMPVVRAVAGPGDIRSLMRIIESNLLQADNADARWRDEAWWLLWPAALIVLFCFRKGWTMLWRRP